MKNLFRPCPIRDHHKIAYDMISRFHAKPLDGEAEKAIADDDYHSRMFEYDARLAEILDPFWDKDFLSDNGVLEAPGRSRAR
jgi:hypothetical protein